MQLMLGQTSFLSKDLKELFNYVVLIEPDTERLKDWKCNAIYFHQACLLNSLHNEQCERLPTRSQNEVNHRVWQQDACLLSCQLENSTFFTSRWAKKGARCLDGVRGSWPLYTMIAWLLRRCTFQAKKRCFFKGRSPLFFPQNPQGIATHFRLAKSWDDFDGPHNTSSYCRERTGHLLTLADSYAQFPIVFRWSTE